MRPCIQRPHQVEWPCKVALFVQMRRSRDDFPSQDSPDKEKQAPFIRAGDDYSEGDFNVIMRWRHFPALSDSSAQAASSNVSFFLAVVS